MSHSTSITRETTSASSITVQNGSKALGAEEFSGIKWLDKLVGDYNFNRYGIYPIALLLIGCLSGVAIGLGGMSTPLGISILVVPTMASLTMILAVAPMRLLLWTTLFAIAVDVIMIAYYLAV